ncbi:IclR family transcriptional regulator [Sphingomonas ginkgonis]|uniref:IclR family transcriptional regulator n=1 Tax=Sphingomonas ginkgonis TaxID=2315330 RepID=A0A429VC00_9SPHN|nr:IclR family transcriptional regulator [Sphingomonas ginkgonis]RST31525.1 IclR family transcriptional regulator [Sphingomonas ginkgonis]
MEEPPKYRAPALQKGLAILETLAHSQEPMSMSDISSALSRSRNEIFRMLQVLEDMHYITKDTAGGYTLTNRLFALGMQQPPVRDLLDHALPHMHRLSEALDQSCHLGVASGSEMVVIARVEAPGMLGFAVRVGYRRPLHLSASGQVIAAFQPEPVLEQMVGDMKRAGETVGRKPLEKLLAPIRAQGHLVRESEVVNAVVDLSAPILVHDFAVAALTVPFMRGAGVKIDEAAATDLLCRTAETISHELEGTRIA